MPISRSDGRPDRATGSWTLGDPAVVTVRSYRSGSARETPARTEGSGALASAERVPAGLTPAGGASGGPEIRS